MVGPPGLQGPQGLSLVVKDANGTLVGVASELNYDVVREGARAWGFYGVVPVVRRIGGQAVVFGTVEGGFFEDTPSLLDMFLLYESTDCSGPALMTSDVQTLLPHALVHGGTAYYPSGSPSLIAPQSYLSAGHVQTDCPGQFSPPDVCCLVAGVSGPLPLSPATTVDLTSLSLVPPFHSEGP
jgi:hypothetical protein